MKRLRRKTTVIELDNNFNLLVDINVLESYELSSMKIYDIRSHALSCKHSRLKRLFKEKNNQHTLIFDSST